MRILLLLLLCSAAIAPAATNEIDSLNTKEAVDHFLRTKVFPRWKDVSFFDTTKAENFRKKREQTFFKADLDNNGLTDLLVQGEYFFAVMDKATGKYDIQMFDRGSFLIEKHRVKNIIYKNNIPLLLIGWFSEHNGRKYAPTIDSLERKTDTLLYQYGGFCEYNPVPDSLSIEEIEFTTSGCFGSCPVFELSIKGDGRATYKAIKHNKEEGKFKARIDSASLAQLFKTINYLQLHSLKDEYSVGWTDDQTVNLSITFTNGWEKKISDYGAIGTYGLQCLYAQLFALRETQQWK